MGALKNVLEAPLEVGDLLEVVEGTAYQIGEMHTNDDGTRIHVRLDRKLEPSIELIIRKRRYFNTPTAHPAVTDIVSRIWNKWRGVRVQKDGIQEMIKEAAQAGWDAATDSIAEG